MQLSRYSLYAPEPQCIRVLIFLPQMNTNQVLACRSASASLHILPGKILEDSGFWFIVLMASYHPTKYCVSKKSIIIPIVFFRYGSNRRRNSSILRRQEEFSLHPLSLHAEHTGLPTYDQVVAQGDSYSPPPPYPGPSGMFKVFKKSLSLPGP